MVFDETMRAALYAASIEVNTLPAKGVYQHPYITPAPYYRFAGCQWVWDIPYSGWATARVGGRVDLAKGFVRNTLALQDLDGLDAGMVPLAPRADGSRLAARISQAPLLSWITLSLHRLEPDPEFIRFAFPRLRDWLRWWRSPLRDFDGDGLSEYAGPETKHVAWESGIDFGPDKDILMKWPAPVSDDGLIHDPVADVTLNAFLYREHLALAELARELSEPDGALRDEATGIASAMNAAMWDEELGAFFPCVRADLVASRPKLCRVTPLVVMPLWAGLASPEQAARTVDLMRGMPAGWPVEEYLQFEGRMDIACGSPEDLLFGYGIRTRGLHPMGGHGEAAGGIHAGEVERTAAGWRTRSPGSVFHFEWNDDRAVPETRFANLAFELSCEGIGSVRLDLTDGRGLVSRPIDAAGAGPHHGGTGRDAEGEGSVRGISRIEITADPGITVAALRVSYGRATGGALLSAYGVRSNHPLDGAFPARGGRSPFWTGQIWGPYVWHTCHALRDYGYEALAQSVARAYCTATERAFASGGTSYEFLSPWDGTGMGAPDYTWGAATALLLDAEILGANSLVTEAD